MTAAADDLIRIRREIHAFAELPFLEIRTAALVVRELRGLPCSIRLGRDAMRPDVVEGYPDAAARAAAAERAIAAGADPGLAQAFAEHGTAVIADIEGSRPGPTWAIRFDMDALPIEESSEPDHLPARLGFRSTTGAMHACGHDGHVAIGLALARRLADRDFAGRVRLLFQPAEESVRGAAAMISAGAADGVDRFLAIHLGNTLPSGTMVGSAVGLQATTKFAAVFRGVAAHAAGAPQHGRNAIAAAAVATTGILALPRSSDGVTNVNVGTISGGSATNIIPDRAALTGEVRSDAEAVCAQLYDGVTRVVAAAAAMHDVGHELRATARSTTIASDDELVDQVLACAERRFGSERLRRTAVLSASDDASLWAAEVQRAGGLATYVLVGSGNPAPHHNPRFDIDESSMSVGLSWLEDIVREAR